MYRSEDELQEIVNRLDIDTEPNPEHREKLRQEMLSVFNDPSQRPIGSEAGATTLSKRQKHNIMERLTTMKPLYKIAATLILLVGIGTLVAILTSGNGRSIAFAEVVKPIFTARTVTYKATTNVEGQLSFTAECMFMEPGRTRQTTFAGVVISDLQQGKTISLVPALKQATVMEMENIPSENEDQSKFNMFGDIRNRIQQAQENEDESVESLGEQEIDGVPTIGYHIKSHSAETTIWANANSLLPIRIEYTVSTIGPATYTISDIVFDVELDESLFSLEIPEGYTVQTMQADASEIAEKDLIEMFDIWAEFMDGKFPSSWKNASMEIMKYQINKMKKMKAEGQEAPSEMSMVQVQKDAMKLTRGMMFVVQLPKKSDWHYAGKDVKLGDAETPIFWYRPKDSETYRVIYGDLRIKDLPPSKIPQSP